MVHPCLGRQQFKIAAMPVAPCLANNEACVSSDEKIILLSVDCNDVGILTTFRVCFRQFLVPRILLLMRLEELITISSEYDEGNDDDDVDEEEVRVAFSLPLKERGHWSVSLGVLSERNRYVWSCSSGIGSESKA